MNHVSNLDSVKAMAQKFADEEGKTYQVFRANSPGNQPFYWFKREDSNKQEVYPWNVLECTVQPVIVGLLYCTVVKDPERKIDTWA